tara:strand:+ start:37 stop:198 length:162 start_codon:yes stop_codon:yes gene_type:complete
MSAITNINKEKINQSIANIFQFIEETQVGDWQELKNQLEELHKEVKNVSYHKH